MPVLYPIAVAVHASSGILGFCVGLVLFIRPDLTRRRWTAWLYAGLLIALVVGLLVAVMVHWPALGVAARLVDAGLIVLAGYTLARGLRAVRISGLRPVGWTSRVIDGIGFTLISLFDGFVIVASIRAGLAMPLVVGVGAVGVVVGIVATNRLKARAESGVRRLQPAQRMGE